jgi:hypothetical protein
MGAKRWQNGQSLRKTKTRPWVAASCRTVAASPLALALVEGGDGQGVGGAALGGVVEAGLGQTRRCQRSAKSWERFITMRW